MGEERFKEQKKERFIQDLMSLGKRQLQGLACQEKDERFGFSLIFELRDYVHLSSGGKQGFSKR